jgi:hypothetical protein
MANPAKTRLGKTAKKNYDATNAGNRHGSISFGHISADGAVTSDVCIQASDGRHGIRLEKDGPRKGCVQVTGPGRIAIQSKFIQIMENTDFRQRKTLIFLTQQRKVGD